MDTRINSIAAIANISSYGKEATKKYIDGAPHIKHAALRLLYSKLVVQVFDSAKQNTKIPKVLDLGAGEGSVTLPFLELGAKVVAVDISRSQLDELQSKCSRFSGMLEARCEDINVTLSNNSERYDIIVANSFLHHIPDYSEMIRVTIPLLNHYGQFFSFQDPLCYDTVGKSTMLFSKFAYLFWRVFKGDVLGGMKRWFRRTRGIFLEDSVNDNTEYHVIRSGVDQNAIKELFNYHKMACDIIPYFSTQNLFFQKIGTSLGMMNTFAIIARKQE
jgi:SAM-dependent methyltransferase